MEYFYSKRSLIEKTLREFFAQEKTRASSINQWGGDLAVRLDDFCSQGKMIRGGLVLLAHDIMGGTAEHDSLYAAAAMELFQSGFLVHDDIMDRDELRRGKPSLFAQYMTQSDGFRVKEQRRFGESMGICAGDVSFFWGYQLLATMSSAENSADIFRTVSRELAIVGIAQMQDVYFGLSGNSPGIDDIISLYIHKTGRYTFSMPLIVGAKIAGASEDIIDIFSRMGEKLGIIFQIRDDELGLFGESADIGKVAGSDIRENKKSIFREMLFARLLGDDREKCTALFGSNDIFTEDVAYIRSLILESGVRRDVREIVERLAVEVRSHISLLKEKLSGNVYIPVLDSLLEYSLTRTK